jgi:tetratricopeptide (TPR) repeat protein
MRPIGILRICILLACCTACASGTTTERSPEHIRQSLRYVNKAAGLYERGCFANALEQFMEAHERYAAADHMAGTAASLNGIANAYYRLGELDSALLVFDEAAELFRELGDLRGEIRVFANKGVALAEAGRTDEGRTALDRADDLAGPSGMLERLRLKNRAILMIHRGDVAGAAALVEKAVELSQGLRDSQYAAIQYTYGRLLLLERKPDRAVGHFEQALDMDRSRGAYFGIAQNLEGLGAADEQAGRYDRALQYYKRSLKGFALLGSTKQAAAVRRSLERVAERSGADIRATLHWSRRWMEGSREANLCR